MSVQPQCCRAQRPALAPGARPRTRRAHSIATSPAAAPQPQQQAGWRRSVGGAGSTAGRRLRTAAAAAGPPGTPLDVEPVSCCAEGQLMLSNQCCGSHGACVHMVMPPPPHQPIFAQLCATDTGAGWVLHRRNCGRAPAAGRGRGRRGAGSAGVPHTDAAWLCLAVAQEVCRSLHACSILRDLVAARMPAVPQLMQYMPRLLVTGEGGADHPRPPAPAAGRSAGHPGASGANVVRMTA